MLGKHIFIGLDGTWQAAFRDPFKSNVHRLNVALDNRDADERKNPQIFIYSAGVGTSNRSSRLYAGVTGEGINALILEAYINLASNYVPGDKIYIFGFSRGAFAARALTGFISHAGLLKADHLSYVEDAWIDFTDRRKAKREYLSLKSGAVHTNVKIEFLGVWDTVIGTFMKKYYLKRYHFDGLQPVKIINTTVHIMSADDNRWDYKPIPFETRDGRALEQIWMPGVHADIGGGYNESFLSTMSLIVMIDKLKEYCPDIAFDAGYIQSVLLEALNTNEAIVNNERTGFWRWFGVSLTRRIENAKHHMKHPLLEMLARMKEINYKGHNKVYTPSLPLTNGQKLPVTTFCDDSWYRRKVERLLHKKFGL
jgi:uncharacterized protein (DUF2235 family)